MNCIMADDAPNKTPAKHGVRKTQQNHPVYSRSGDFRALSVSASAI